MLLCCDAVTVVVLESLQLRLTGYYSYNSSDMSRLATVFDVGKCSLILSIDTFLIYSHILDLSEQKVLTESCLG